MRATVQVESDKWKKAKQLDVWSPQRGPFGKGKGGGGQYQSPGKGGKLGGKRIQFVPKLKGGGKICYYHNTMLHVIRTPFAQTLHICKTLAVFGGGCYLLYLTMF